MPQGYSVYVFGDDGHIKERIDVVCENDAEAKDQAEQMLDGHPLEVWQEARRLVTLQPKK